MTISPEMLAGLEGVCPNILGNPYLAKHFPHAPQLMFLGSHQDTQKRDPDAVYEAMFGGAAGGGKSDALLMGAAQYAWKHPEFSGVIIRRSHAELAAPGALMNRAMKWWIPAGVHWNGSDKLFTFPNGAQVKMAYHAHVKDDHQFQSAEYQYAAFDELTHWENSQAYEWVKTRLRRPANSTLPLRLLSASNPGGPGHIWVKHRFVGGKDMSGKVIIPMHPYYPSFIEDNPSLDQSYRANLMTMSNPTRREQLLRGDWSVREPGDYFSAEWFGPLLDPEDKWPQGDCTRIRWWDLAASEKDDAAYTSGVLMARHHRGVRAVEHCTSFRAIPGRRDAKIIQQAQIDGRHVRVGIEIEPGSGGVAQFDALEKRLRAAGFRAEGARPKAELSNSEGKVLFRAPVGEAGKTGRATPCSSCLYVGHERRGECPDTGAPWWGKDHGKPLASQAEGIRLYAGEWVQSFLDNIEGFPSGLRSGTTSRTDTKSGLTYDEVDAMVGAFYWLEAHHGTQRPPGRDRVEKSDYVSHDVHPEDRPDPRQADKTRGGL